MLTVFTPIIIMLNINMASFIILKVFAQSVFILIVMAPPWRIFQSSLHPHPHPDFEKFDSSLKKRKNPNELKILSSL